MLLNNHEFNGYFSSLDGDDKPMTDTLIQLPSFNTCYDNKLLEQDFITQERLDIEIDASKDITKSTW